MSSGRFRVVRTLWFEELGLCNVRIFETPAGRLSIRQLVILLVFAVLGYASSIPFDDLIYKAAFGGAVFAAGFVLASRGVKVVAPERMILLAFGFGRLSPESTRPSALMGERGRRGGVEAEAPAGIMRVSAELESPVKVVGVLRDPSAGEVLCGKPYEVLVGGELCGSGVSDEQGFFTAFFTPRMYGEFEVEVRPEGYAGGQIFKLIVEPKGGVKVA